MNFREIEKIIRDDGWCLKNAEGSHRHYVHAVKPGKVTIPFHGNRDISPASVNSILRQAGLKK